MHIIICSTFPIEFDDRTCGTNRVADHIHTFWREKELILEKIIKTTLPERETLKE